MICQARPFGARGEGVIAITEPRPTTAFENNTQDPEFDGNLVWF